MLRIRAARPNDAAALMRVHREAVFSKAASHYPQATLDAWSPGATPNRVAHIEKEIADPAFIVLVAEAGKEISGFAMAIPQRTNYAPCTSSPTQLEMLGARCLPKWRNWPSQSLNS